MLVAADKDQKPVVLGKTEAIKNTLNPQFNTVIEMDYEFGKLLHFQIAIYDEIRKAKTDSQGQINYDPENRHELANLLRIYASLSGIPPNKVDQLFESDNMFSFKEKLSNLIIDKLCPIGEKAMDLCENSEDLLLEIVDKGAQDANKVAEQTLVQMKK